MKSSVGAEQRKRNLRLRLSLATVALAVFVGFMLKMAFGL